MRPLPLSTTSFVGRERDEAAVAHLLHRGDVRLLTLTGPSGVGKTRLAVQVAAGLTDAYPDGVAFVDLACVTTIEGVSTALATAVGVPSGPGHAQRPGTADAVADALAACLASKHMLLVLDTVEHVVSALALLPRLLASCPDVVILATGRCPLGVQGECVFPVPMLAYPDPICPPPAEDIAHYAAVTLYVQRVRAMLPDFVVTEPLLVSIAALCARLDGLPLAIELAASRVVLLPPAVLLGRRTHMFALLTGGPRDAPARHQGLRASLDWSYELLDARPRALVRRLSVFEGDCTLDAVEVVCRSIDGTAGDLLDDLTALMDMSLLQVTRVDAETAAGPRVALLNTTRQYGSEYLERSGEAETMYKRHAAYYLALAERASVGELPVLLTDERDNLHAAWCWAQEHGGLQVGERLVRALQGHGSEYRPALQVHPRLPEAALETTSPGPQPVRERSKLHR